MNEPKQLIKPSIHAERRWRELTGSTKSDTVVNNKLRKAFMHSYEVELKEQYRLKQLLNHNCEPARYFRCQDMILVVSQDLERIITVHDGKAGRWSKPKHE